MQYGLLVVEVLVTLTVVHWDLGAIQVPGQNGSREIPIKLIDSAKQVWDVVRDAANKQNEQCDRNYFALADF